MDIVALMGSPRKHGNTDMLIDEMIKGAEENGHNVVKHYISDLDVHPCRGCGVCTTGKDCVFKDDGLEVTHQIANAEGLIVSSPIYFGQMTGDLKISDVELFELNSYVLSDNGKKLLDKIAPIYIESIFADKELAEQCYYNVFVKKLHLPKLAKKNFCFFANSGRCAKLNSLLP